MNYFSALCQHAEPEVFYCRPHFSDWVAVEKEIGVSFPAEYKAFIDYFGSGYFGEGLRFLNPVDWDKERRLCHSTLFERRCMLEFLEESCGLVMYPAVGGRIWIGGYERLDLFYNLKVKPGLDVVDVFDHNNEEMFQTGCSLCEIIYRLFIGEPNQSWMAHWRVSLVSDSEPKFFVPLKPR